LEKVRSVLESADEERRAFGAGMRASAGRIKALPHRGDSPDAIDRGPLKRTAGERFSRRRAR